MQPNYFPQKFLEILWARNIRREKWCDRARWCNIWGLERERLFENEIKGLNGEIFCFVLGGKYCVRLTAGIKHFTFHVVFILAFNLWI